jgi:hypothetical protein
MQYGMFYMQQCEQSGGHSRTHFPAHQTANTNARNTYSTAFIAVSLRMNTRGYEHVGDIRN